MISYDDELRRHNEVLRTAAGVRFSDHVLDIGCGTGLTTREAARAASSGSAFGVDVSASAIGRARQLAEAERLGNITFERADAQVHPFTRDRFDLAISRFGTMFFDEPVDAFTNVGRALRRTGRLAMLVWQARDRNEWAVSIREALGTGGTSAADSDSNGPNAFSLADPSIVTNILERAGFVGVAFTDVNEPVYYGPDVAAAEEWVRGFTTTAEAMSRSPSAAAADEATDRLHEMLAAHMTDAGVWLESRSWIVTARLG